MIPPKTTTDRPRTLEICENTGDVHYLNQGNLNGGENT